MSRSNKRKSRKLSQEPVTVTIESLSHDGRGVTHVEDKAVFIDGALTGEVVRFVYTNTHKNYDEGKAVEIIEASPDRVEPACPHYGDCGGCSLQHLHPEKQILAKQEVLIENFARIGKVKPENILPPLTGLYWGYRRKARLGVKNVRKKGRVLVGFREKRSPFLLDMHQCEVLHPSVGHRIDELSEMIMGLEAYNRIAQIEVAVSDDITALVFRNLDPLSHDDAEKLKAFGKEYDLHVYIQPAGPSSVTLLYPEESELVYRLDAYDIELSFRATDFTQVNYEINRQMVDRTLALLELEKTDRVLDLFCGIGNFTLPMARHACEVTGVEGESVMIQRARDNASRNNIRNVQFFVNDLAEDLVSTEWSKQSFDKVLLDPPRSGAEAIINLVANTGAERIVYVSCHPGSLARDAGELVKLGYKLQDAGVMDMFPHTAHVESIALFLKK